LRLLHSLNLLEKWGTAHFKEWDGIRRNLKARECEDVDWIQQAKVGTQRRALVCTVIKLRAQ
jgi:hypothetical protein